MSRLPGPEEQWEESSEGDLDPDLAEESPYSDWDLPRRNPWWPVIMRLVVALLILSLVIPTLLMAVR